VSAGRDVRIEARCAICGETKAFSAPDDYLSCRMQFRTTDCPLNGCIPRSRAIGQALFSLYSPDDVKQLAVHESSPSPAGISLWLRRNCPGYVMSAYFPDDPFGNVVRGFRNEDLENQTFADGSFDLVLHLDVMEHLFNPFTALSEIKRTLKPGGVCLFTAPTYAGRTVSEQVAFLEPGGGLRIVGEPEYHGNPQSKQGSLVTWRYGYDLPYQINRRTGFDVEVRRWYAPSLAIMGTMTEVYILRNQVVSGGPSEAVPPRSATAVEG
jgi:SAM-dependent methyltransferase